MVEIVILTIVTKQNVFVSDLSCSALTIHNHHCHLSLAFITSLM